MSESKKQIRKEPCPSCPYRKDVPSGVWDRSEYEKLPKYDLGTTEQFLAGAIGVFYCHQQNGCVCRGWIDCHGNQGDGCELISLRISKLIDHEQVKIAIEEGPQVPIFESGREACEHGLKEICNPSSDASEVISKVVRIQDVRKAKSNDE